MFDNIQSHVIKFFEDRIILTTETSIPSHEKEDDRRGRQTMLSITSSK